LMRFGITRWLLNLTPQINFECIISIRKSWVTRK
jgi:hypothetical protein